MIATHTARAKTSPATVLLADADQGRAPQLRGMLESAGHRVITAADGAATLRMLSAHASDLVLCDAALPDLDGFEVCRAIKQAPATADTPVVMLVDNDDELQRERALQAGADDVTTKPVERAALLTLIRSQLRIARLTMQLNDISLPTISYLSTLTTARVNYNFNTKMFLNALLQYTTDTHQLSSNIRFNIIHRPLSDIFFVYNEHRDELTGLLQDRSLIAKMTYMVAF